MAGNKPDGAKLKCKSRGDKKIINRKMFYIVTMVIFLHSFRAIIPYQRVHALEQEDGNALKKIFIL